MTQKLQWLEVMRGVAACWVLVYHANQSVTNFIGPSGEPHVLISNGYLGVDFFFVLSGFIIAYSSNRLLETGRGLVDYARARIVRVYVPYLPIGTTMFMLYLVWPHLSAADRSPGLLTSLTLLPSNSPPALSVAWTLVHEIIFYALFSLFFLWRHALWSLLALWAISIGCYVWLGQPLARGLEYLLSPLNLCFLLGVAVYYLTRKGVAARVAIAAAVVGAVVVVFEASQQQPSRWLLALGFSALIVGASSATARCWNPRRWMMTLGAASYSIYLSHGPVLSIAVRGFRRILPDAGSLAALLVISVFSLAVGLVYCFIYERRALVVVREFFTATTLMAAMELVSSALRRVETKNVSLNGTIRPQSRANALLQSIRVNSRLLIQRQKCLG
ncbi:acyltransferase [Dokdonella soli]|uniref:acyltransferase family protein n=1 Tax=Dokdonella soli TaxID=529810 RepID=UPI0031E1D64C